MAKRLILALIAGLTLTAGLAACGDSDDDAETTSASQSTPAVTSSAGDTGASTPAAAVATTAATTAAATPSGPQTLTVKAGDYFYEPTEFRVQPGTISLTMTNDGPERPHTFVIKNPSGDGDLFKTERVPVGSPVTVEFTIMEEGTYEVYCNLPGHADRGQRGTLTVSRT